MADKYNCRKCHKNVAATGQSPSPLRYRKHDGEKSIECENSRTIIPGWMVRRGPETEEDDRPVIGRDYAQCPECKRSPLLDDDGKFALHIREAGVPSAERVDCPMSGQPYTPEGEECPTVPDTPTPEASADSAPAAPSTPPTSPSEPTAPPTSGERQTAPTAPASTATDARPAAGPARESEGPTEAEQLLSKWATKVREIEDRKLPETDPSPESTPTPQALPPRPDAPAAPPAAKPDSASTEPARTTPSAADAAPASEGASPNRESSESASATTDSSPEPVPPEPATAAPASPTKSNGTGTAAPTPDSTSTDSAAPEPAAVRSRQTPCGHDVTSKCGECETTAAQTLRAHRAEAAAAARTPTPDAEPSTAATPTIPAAAPPSSSPFSQPGSPFSQPAKLPAAVTDPIPMTVPAEQIAARMRELFFSYGNRQTDDNRSAQVTLGPSAIGSPCNRRIAMSLLRIPAVNPGGDGWAAFKGTAIHAALAELFTWASADTGRFAVEVPLRLPSKYVPGGTTDLLDRVLLMVDDHKIQSRWSQDRLKVDGMTATQRVQLHTYGFGARLQGEEVEHVALISWPMESSSLDDLYVVVEPYDPQIARDALARVDGIAAEVQAHETERATWAGLDIAAQNLDIARQFDVADDCRFCPFYAPGDPGMTRGCNGRS